MITKHLVSLPHHPKRVIAISSIIALTIGILGYQSINMTAPIQAPVKTAEAPAEVAEVSPVTTGNISNISLGFLVGGRIKAVSVASGAIVKKGQVLAALDGANALGVLAVAKANYETAEANYQKIVNGPTSGAVDVAKASVHTAEVNLDGVTKQQALLVKNARRNLLNSKLSAILVGNSNNTITPPEISGAYTADVEGSIIFKVNSAGNEAYLTFEGLLSGTSPVSTTIPKPLGETGLYLKFPSLMSYLGTSWQIDIPNKTASDYLANSTAYQSALESQTRAISNAQASLDQSRASLAELQAGARAEDIAAAKAQTDNAKGSLQIAQAAYRNTMIIAPQDGVVASVAIAPGQIALPNTAAIEFTKSN